MALIIDFWESKKKLISIQLSKLNSIGIFLSWSSFIYESRIFLMISLKWWGPFYSPSSMILLILSFSSSKPGRTLTRSWSIESWTFWGSIRWLTSQAKGFSFSSTRETTFSIVDETLLMFLLNFLRTLKICS